MLVTLAGAVWWAVVVAAVVIALAMIGQGVTYHYFTDTVGCAAAWQCRGVPRRGPRNLTRVNPRATQITPLANMGL